LGDDQERAVRLARLLREGKTLRERPVCIFHIGRPGDDCRRCGASWRDHATHVKPAEPT
jgi:hypothetical protein